MKKILFLFLFILAINSCKKDDDNLVAPDNRDYTPKIITETYGNAKLVGFVNDKSGNPLSDVTVFFGAEKTLTKADGSYQLNTLSAGSNKRIWFQKTGYASTQKLAGINEELPNRIDASLFQIDKIEKINSDDGKIEREDFSVEIQPGGFVYSDGSPVEEDVTIEVTAFLTSEDEFLDAFPGDFRGTRIDGSETAIESFGFIDVVLKVESGEPVQLADGVTAIIKIKAPENAPATIPMWYYDEDKAQWIEEGVGSLDKGFYTAEVSHFTKWNWDRPIELISKIVGRVVDNLGNPIEGASVIQKGITYSFQNSTKTNEDGEFELLTPESNESEIEAQFDIYGSTIVNYTTSPNKGQVNNIDDIIINVTTENILAPLISNNIFYITMGQTAKIKGNYFGNLKRAGFKLLLNGNEVETTTWQNDLIEFDVPNGIAEEGTIQIDRDGFFSREVNYKEGDWTCEIDGKIYDNNDLPIDDGRYHLNLFNRSLKKIPNCIGNLQSLEELSLDRNQLTTIPESIGKLKYLEELVLTVNELISLPESFGNLQNLKWLYLQTNQLSSLPVSFGNLQKLQMLELDGNQLTTLPESFGNLKNLDGLWLNDNQLSSLPESFGDFQNLKSLYLQTNQLSSLPENFSNLQNLEQLNLGNNQLISLPESFGNLQNLKLVNFQSNQLTTLPESFGNLQNLKLVDFQSNQLTTLPESFGNLQNLVQLEINDNQLSSLPENFGNLQNLKELFLYNNELSGLPESISNLEDLELLELSYNKLNNLPESIGNLQNLKWLIINGNQLNSLPESIGNLQNLYELNLGDNELSTLPESIKNLKGNLDKLILYVNNFSLEERAKIEEWLPNTDIRW